MVFLLYRKGEAMKNFHTVMDITSINRVPAHTRWRAYENEKQALTCESGGEAVQSGNSRYIQSLDGMYQFKLFPTPEAVPENFWESQGGFTGIPVPGCWELFGHGEPIYTNYFYPWDYNAAGNHLIKPKADGANTVNPPYIPEDNPTGCYCRLFDVPDYYTGRDIFLRFDGVETAYTVWVNGEFAGYAEDSKLPSEFDITAFIRPGENHMAVEVKRWCKSSYLEDQDYWHLSGIHGHVWLIAKPKARIQDIKIIAGQNGGVCAEVEVSRVPGFADYTVKMGFYDKKGELLATHTAAVSDRAEYHQRDNPTANTARLVYQIDGAELWSPENPALYTAVFSLISPDNQAVDTEACRVGFKTVEIKNGIVYINGQRIVACGVNRHQHYYKSGRYVTVEQMTKEIIEMKRMNINAVRTSHYPCPDSWYELCDMYGLLVVCECNIETHGLGGQLTHNPAWVSLFVERAARMAQNFKNHSCIYAWSLGNESGTGANHAAMAGFLREYDPTRLCQYEAGGPGKNISDIRGMMYATTGQIMDMLTDTEDDRPVMLVEFLYQIRNSGGGMHHFVELTEKYERFQGGFTWDWSDKCLEQTNAEGVRYFAYGGDFGESVTDPECPLFMTNNGLVLPDLTWKPVAYEVKQAYCPVVIQPERNLSGWADKVPPKYEYELINKSCTQPISEFTILMRLREDGYIVHTQILDVGDLAPLSKKRIHAKPEYTLKTECEYFLEFAVSLKKSTFYASEGYEIGCFQYPLQAPKTSGLSKIPGFSKPSYGTGRKPEGLNFTAPERGETMKTAIKIITDKKIGSVSLIKDDIVYIQSGGIPCLDQPFTGMDSNPHWSDLCQIFGAVRDGNTVTSVREIKESKTGVTVTFEMITQNSYESLAQIRYNQTGTGFEAEAVFDINPNLVYLPRLGLEFILPAGFKCLTYYGLGENENYPDRRMSAKIGVFESTIGKQHFPFVPPSECGGHGETRWLVLSDGGKRTISFTGAAPFHFDARHNSIADYRKARHDHELPARAETYLHIDAAHTGIGSDMAWSTAISREHMVKAGLYYLRIAANME
jgi:beta-galactosidase